MLGFLAWQIFNALMGIIEGAYWHFRNIVVLDDKIFKTPYALKLDLHPYLLALRFLIAISIMKDFIISPIYTQILFATALLISQPFFHLGMMYWIRNKLNSRTYEKGFFDVNKVEKDDSSKLDLLLEKLGLKQINFRLRLVGFIIAFFSILFLQFYG